MSYLCRYCDRPIRTWPTGRWRHVADDMLTCNLPGWPKTHAEPAPKEAL